MFHHHHHNNDNNNRKNDGNNNMEIILHILQDHAYYSFKPHDGFRVLVCDSYDISLLGQDEVRITYVHICTSAFHGVDDVL
jgi:hypothetical protein